MAEKNINSRIMQKHDTEANWNKATNFIPKAGEIVIYDADDTHNAARIKVGNNSAKINELPFVSSNDERIFIAEYGVTTFEEIIEAANTDKKTVLCRINDDGTIFTLAYCHADGARFIGYTSQGEQEACCEPNNEWTISNISIQADWNQNDETALDYIKNRPFYDKIILPETTGGVGLDTNLVMLPTFQLVAGEIYNVNYNGTEYICKCFEESGAFMLGNYKKVMETGDSGEPFVVVRDSVNCGVFLLDGATPITISISIIHKLDKKYLPIVSDDEILAWLSEENIVAPVASVSGELYTTNNNEIYVL